MQKLAACMADYLELCKPRVVALMILTSLVGMVLAPTAHLSLSILILGNLGIALGACSAAAINHFADYHLDQRMRRTENRPVAKGRISPVNTIVFAAVLCALSMWILIQFVNVITAIFTFFSLIMYAGIYTYYLKHATSQNIVIGGIAGAMPPLLGWLAVTGHFAWMPVILVAIIFVWTPPHFWALAINRFEDYANAKVPMLPNTHGIPYTKRSIWVYSWILAVVALLPFLFKQMGLFYGVSVLALNTWFLFDAWSLLKSDTQTQGALGFRLFRTSIVYLMLLFIALLIDHVFF